MLRTTYTSAPNVSVMFSNAFDYNGAVVVRPFQYPNCGLQAFRDSLLAIFHLLFLSGDNILYQNFKKLLQEKKELYELQLENLNERDSLKDLDTNINVSNMRIVALLKLFVVMFCVGWLFVARGGPLVPFMFQPHKEHQNSINCDKFINCMISSQLLEKQYCAVCSNLVGLMSVTDGIKDFESPLIKR